MKETSRGPVLTTFAVLFAILRVRLPGCRERRRCKFAALHLQPELDLARDCPPTRRATRSALCAESVRATRPLLQKSTPLLSHHLVNPWIS